jgi:uncharacterized protein YcsI (UPF0317 family)
MNHDDRTRSYGELAHASGREVRAACWSAAYDGATSGLAPGPVQGNLVILPRDWADQFLRFCQVNPKPCPVLGVAEEGDPTIPQLGGDLDILTDVPRYRIWRDGELVAEPHDLHAVWRGDLVSVVIGCSFSFEEALLQADVPVRHSAQGCNVPMYRTSIAAPSAGRFHGPPVVSMRPLTPADAIRAIQIISRFPAVHGAPVHLRFPEAIGISRLGWPDYGDPVPVEVGELPVFWACGVTLQAAIAAARPPFAVPTHRDARW